MLSLSERFGMADSASNFNGALFNLLEYSADTEIAEQILVGTFVPPLGTPASKIATIDEIGRIWKEMGKGEAEIVVSQDDFQYYWKTVRERTASSYSKLHFSHYTSAAHSDCLSTCYAMKLSLITKSGSSPVLDIPRYASGAEPQHIMSRTHPDRQYLVVSKYILYD